MSAATSYQRPPLAWVKRRARRLQRFYGITRRLAIFDAWRDYTEFVLGQGARLTSITGGNRA